MCYTHIWSSDTEPMTTEADYVSPAFAEHLMTMRSGVERSSELVPDALPTAVRLILTLTRPITLTRLLTVTPTVTPTVALGSVLPDA